MATPRAIVLCQCAFNLLRTPLTRVREDVRRTGEGKFRATFESNSGLNNQAGDEGGKINPSALSCAGQNFVTNQMQPDSFGSLGLVKIIGAHGFLDIPAHGFPCIALGEDIFRKTFGAKAAVFFLRDFKYQFVHPAKISAIRSVLTSWKRFYLVVGEIGGIFRPVLAAVVGFDAAREEKNGGEMRLTFWAIGRKK